MPRIRQKQSEYIMTDFLNEVKAQRARLGLDSAEEFAGAIGISRSSANRYMNTPGQIRLETLRKLVFHLKPDPEIMLKMLGYTGSDIKTMAKIVVSR